VRLPGADSKPIWNPLWSQNMAPVPVPPTSRIRDPQATQAIPSSMLFNANVVDNDLHLRALQQTHFRNGKVACEHSKKKVPPNETICSSNNFLKITRD